jgi:hypothetical protein
MLAMPVAIYMPGWVVTQMTGRHMRRVAATSSCWPHALAMPPGRVLIVGSSNSLGAFRKTGASRAAAQSPGGRGSAWSTPCNKSTMMPRRV